MSPGRWWEGGGGSQSQVAAHGRREEKDSELGGRWGRQVSSRSVRQQSLKMCLLSSFGLKKRQMGDGWVSGFLVELGPQLWRGSFAFGFGAGVGGGPGLSWVSPLERGLWNWKHNQCLGHAAARRWWQRDRDFWGLWPLCMADWLELLPPGCQAGLVSW
jgi:hypothetical protein